MNFKEFLQKHDGAIRALEAIAAIAEDGNYRLGTDILDIEEINREIETIKQYISGLENVYIDFGIKGEHGGEF